MTNQASGGLVESRSALYEAVANAQYSMQGLELAQADTNNGLAGARTQAQNLVVDEATKLISTVKKNAKTLSGVTIGVTVASIITAPFETMSEFGKLDGWHFELALGIGSLGKDFKDEAPEIADKFSQAASQKIRGHVDIDKVAPDLLLQVGESIGKQLAKDLKVLQGVNAAIARFIQGQTRASEIR